MLTENKIESDEHFFNPSWFPVKEMTFFNYPPAQFKDSRHNADPDFAGGIVIQADYNRVINKRKIYNFLDLLGDVGGLSGALYQCGSIFLLLLG